MADTNTPITDLLLQETGQHNNDWGTNLNTAITAIETMTKATRTTATTGGTTVLTKTTAREPIQRTTGILASNAIIEVPAAAVGYWMFKNECTGAFTLTVKVNGQTGVIVPQGSSLMLRNNGTDVVDVGIALPAYNSAAILVGTLGFSADAYSVASNGFHSTLTDGLTILARIANTNTTTSPTFNYATVGAKNILMPDGSAPYIGAIVNGAQAFFTYRSSTDKWYMMTSPAPVTAAAYTNTTQPATTAHVYATVTNLPENVQTGTTYQLVLADAGKCVTITNAAAQTITIPANATVAFPAGTRIDLHAYGAGQLSIAAAGGVTIVSSGSKLKLTGSHSGATLHYRGADTWWLVGDLTT